MRNLTELPAFSKVNDAWGKAMWLRLDTVAAISAAQEGEQDTVPEALHPEQPYHVVTLTGGGRVLVGANDGALASIFGL